MTTEAQITAWLATQQDAMIAQLKEMVNTDGGSYDKAGVDRTGAQVKRFLEGQGIAVEVVPREKHGDCLRGVVPGAHEIASGNQQKNIVLMGHRDTVFPKGEPERRPFTIQGNIAYGPGVADMKAGIVMNMFVLAAFHKFGGATGPLVGLFTGDEEIGSPEGRPVIENEARSARVVFNSEPGRPSGNVVTGRKGAMFVDCEVTGISAHSGVNHQEGASAIEALCRKVVQMHKLTSYDSGTTVNVGLIQGGLSVNTVAPQARASIDVRFKTAEAMEDVKAKLAAIMAQNDVHGTCAHITQQRYFLPLVQSEASKRLFDAYVDSAAAIGFGTSGEYTGGSADSGFTAAAGVPTLCGTGPVGGKVHTADEWLKVSSMVPRAQAIALTALRMHGVS